MKAETELFGIYFTDTYGQRKLYMQTGFESREKAKDELRKILNQRNGSKMFHCRVKDIEDAKLHVSSVLTGTNWRIKKIKLAKRNQV